LPIRRSSFTREEQQARLKAIQLEVLYPYTYRLNRTVSNVLFSIADSNVTGAQYDSFGFVAPETMQIVAIRATCLTQLSSVHTFAWALSYSPLFTMGDTNNGQLPSDQGNEVYRSYFRGSDTLDDFVFFDQDKGWYLSYGETLYWYQWADAAAITAANITMIGALTLYTKPTGLLS
jgi:hypothetical protein